MTWTKPRQPGPQVRQRYTDNGYTEKAGMQRSKVVSIVAWIAIGLGGLGTIVALLQVPLISAHTSFLPYLLANLVWSAFLAALGVGLLRRHPRARTVAIVTCIVGIAWSAYLAVAVALRQQLPLVPQVFYDDELKRMSTLSNSAVWILVFGGVIWLLSRPRVRSEFGGDAV